MRVRFRTLLVLLLAVGGCAQPTPALTTIAAPDLSGVSFEVHQEPG